MAGTIKLENGINKASSELKLMYLSCFVEVRDLSSICVFVFLKLSKGMSKALQSDFITKGLPLVSLFSNLWMVLIDTPERADSSCWDRCLVNLCSFIVFFYDHFISY